MQNLERDVGRMRQYKDLMHQVISILFKIYVYVDPKVDQMQAKLCLIEIEGIKDELKKSIVLIKEADAAIKQKQTQHRHVSDKLMYGRKVINPNVICVP